MKIHASERLHSPESSGSSGGLWRHVRFGSERESLDARENKRTHSTQRSEESGLRGKIVRSQGNSVLRSQGAGMCPCEEENRRHNSKVGGRGKGAS